MALSVCLDFLSARRGCLEKQTVNGKKKKKENRTMKPMRRLGQKQTRSRDPCWHPRRWRAFSSGSGGGSLRDFVQKAGLPVGAVSGSASPGPACVRARAGRPDRGHGGLFRVAGTRPQPGSVSTQGTRSAWCHLVSEPESLLLTRRPH